jgi:hypothetical protein
MGFKGVSRTGQEQKVDASAREGFCIRENAHIWLARRNQGSVCMAISLVVKLTIYPQARSIILAMLSTPFSSFLTLRDRALSPLPGIGSLRTPLMDNIHL